MSTVQQLIAAVTAAQRQIDDQISRLTVYSGQLDQVSSRVDDALRDSRQSYAGQMLQQVAETKSQVQNSLNRLQDARAKLGRLSML